MPKPHVFKHEVTQPLDQSYRLIPLTQGQNAIVDAEDFEWLNQWNWCANWDEDIQGYYALRKAYGGGPVIMMARIIKGVSDPSIKVDHFNHDTLDNRKHNLRACTNAENCRNQRIRSTNKSGFKGVHFHKRDKKWVASIQIGNGKRLSLGYHNSPEEAARAYNEAARKYHGEFVLLNHVNH